MYEGLKKLTAAMEEARQRTVSEGKNALGAAFKELFDAYPEIKAVRWTQYTPHFNDGDACEFTVHDFTAQIEGVKTKYRLQDGFLNAWDIEGKNAAMEAVRALYRATPHDAMQDIFGDHSQITATRDGFEVEEYSHD